MLIYVSVLPGWSRGVQCGVGAAGRWRVLVAGLLFDLPKFRSALMNATGQGHWLAGRTTIMAQGSAVRVAAHMFSAATHCRSAPTMALMLSKAAVQLPTCKQQGCSCAEHAVATAQMRVRRSVHTVVCSAVRSWRAPKAHCAGMRVVRVRLNCRMFYGQVAASTCRWRALFSRIAQRLFTTSQLVARRVHLRGVTLRYSNYCTCQTHGATAHTLIACLALERKPSTLHTTPGLSAGCAHSARTRCKA